MWIKGNNNNNNPLALGSVANVISKTQTKANTSSLFCKNSSMYSCVAFCFSNFASISLQIERRSFSKYYQGEVMHCCLCSAQRSCHELQ